MTLSTGGVCVICQEEGCNSELMSKVPVGIAGVPARNGQRKSGMFYTTTERVWRNGCLVHGVGQPIPYEEAVALGLVEDKNPPLPIEVAPSTPLVEAGDQTLVPEPASETAAIVRKRKSRRATT